MSYTKIKGYMGAADIVPFTASANQTAGDVVVVQGRVGVVKDDVVSGAKGLMIVGTDELGILMPKATGAISRHAKLYWDEDGDPVGGTAGTGALTTTSTSNIYVGRAAAASLSGDAEAQVQLTNE